MNIAQVSADRASDRARTTDPDAARQMPRGVVGSDHEALARSALRLFADLYRPST